MLRRTIYSHLYNNRDHTEKNTFLYCVIGIVSFLLCTLIGSIICIIVLGPSNTTYTIPLIIIFGCSIFMFPFIWAAIELTLLQYVKWTFINPLTLRNISIKVFLPLVEVVARIFSIPIASVRRSFVMLNNELLVGAKLLYSPQDVLVLVAHCSQASHCKFRLTYNSDNCKRCGKCPIGHLLILRDTFGIQLITATGGTRARHIAAQTKPKFIIGVACERDLVSGIQDLPVFPIFGFFNECPNGPCIDTLVDVDSLRKYLVMFVSEPEPVLVNENGYTSNIKTCIDLPRYKNVVEYKENVIQ